MSAYEQGKTAYRNGYLLSDNPYRGRSGYERETQAWDGGFRDAKDDK